MLTLTDQQLDRIAERIPGAPISPKDRRPTADKRRTLRGSCRILDNGAKWKDLPPAFGAKSTLHRWFAKWGADGLFERLLQSAGRLVETRGGYVLHRRDVLEGQGRRRRRGRHACGKRRENHGSGRCPRPAGRGRRPPPARTRASRFSDCMLTEQTPPRVIGDKAYDCDCDEPDAELAERGLELIAPHRANRKPRNVTQDRRPPRRYRRRWRAKRSIAWIQNFRRLCIRWEKSTKLFQGFLHLACTFLSLRPVLG